MPRWASPAITVAVLAVVAWRLGTGPFLSGVEAVDGRTLLAAAGIVLVTTACSAWRWAIVARGIGVPLSFRGALAAYYRALFLNLTLPSGVAGDIHRGISHGRDAHDVSGAVRAVVWERGAGQVVQAALTVGVLLAFPSPIRPWMPLALLALCVVAAAAVVTGRSQRGSDSGSGSGSGSRWGRLRSSAVRDIRVGLLRRGAWPAVALTSVVVVVGHAVTFLIAARTVGATASTSRLLPLAVVALLAMVLPSVAGWGPREGATAWVFAAAGLGASRGAAAAVTYGVLVLVASLPGAVVLVVGRRSRQPSTSLAFRRRPVPLDAPQ